MDRVRIRPVTPDGLIVELADLIADARVGAWLRAAIDGAPATGPDELADALVDPLRARGRAVVRVRAGDYLRPASLRLEHGRYDPEAYYEDWLDADALDRDVLRPLATGGSGRVRPVRWDAVADRASRLGFVDVPPGGVALLSGALLLGRGLDLDLTVHCDMSSAALRRRTPPDWEWTLPAFDRYRDEVDPVSVADLAVRLDDPRHPALA